jgi:uncharacterized membrane protein (UPF0182 family)
MASPEQPRRGRIRRPGRGRTIAVLTVVALFVLVASLRGLAGFYTDYLWFKSLGLVGVWRAVLGARVVLAIVFMAAFALFMWGNLVLADRLAPQFRPRGPEEELIERYYQVVGSRVRLVRAAVSVLFGVVAGAGVSSEWNEWILFTHAVSFGEKDAQFGRDIGFYVFRLPFLTFLVNWMFASLVIIILATAGWHYLNGGMRVQVRGEHITAKAKGHLSALLALLAIVKAVDYYLARFQLTTSTRGVVDGATFTDVKAQLPALSLLLAIAIFAVVLLGVNVRRRGLALPGITVGLWVLVSLVAGTIYPAFVQRVRVDPAESSKERTYVERNIAATRRAFGLDTVSSEATTYVPTLTPADVNRNIDTIANARVIDPAQVNATFQKLQSDRQFYTFTNQQLDVDRFTIDGKTTPAIIGTRELNPRVQGSWENAHIVYTHGFGVVIAPANTAAADGSPDFLVRDVPTKIDPEVQLSLDNPRLYYGDSLSGYAIIDATRQEVDYLTDANTEQLFTHTEQTGVAMGSIFRRAAFALRFGQIEPLISNFVKSDSRIIYIRDVRERVQTIAPFLSFDHDPYPVVMDGRVKYVIDGYTTTSHYPYSQRASGRSSDSGLDGRINYVRNSVRAVVDAYSGEVTFYVVDQVDPIIKAYEKAFPELFTPGDQMPAELRDHDRYPQDIFEIQSEMWARYHVDNPQAFLSQSDGWAVSPDPGSQVNASVVNASSTTSGTLPDRNATTTRDGTMKAYYSLVKLPGDTTQSFGLTRPFVPVDDSGKRLEMTAYMFGALDSTGRPSLRVFETPAGQQIGPALFASRSEVFPDLSKEVSLLNVQGSQVSYGDVLLIPLEKTILFVRPLYVTDASNSVPALKRVIVGVGDQYAIGTSLADALEKLVGQSIPALGGSTPTTPGKPGTPSTTAPPTTGTVTPGTPSDALSQVRDKLQQALTLQADAVKAEASRQYETAGQKRAQAQALIEEATRLSGGVLPPLPATAATTTTLSSASSTTSPTSGSASSSTSTSSSGPPTSTTGRAA